MTKRITWLVVSGLMVLSLVLVSCAPKVTEEKKEVVTEKKEVVTEKKEVTEKEGAEIVVDALGRSVPKPQYGGVLNVAESRDPDGGFSFTGLNRTPALGYMRVTNEPLLMRDWLKGPAGSGEWDGLYTTYPLLEHMTGGQAESWEVIQPDTLIFRIRKGIHWQDKAPTYGAELTAGDVVYTFLVRYARTGGVYRTMFPALSNMAKPEESIYIHPDDPWAVVFKSKPGELGLLWETVANYDFIVPKALGPIAGEGFGDWRGVVGTGPFLLTDYVAGSSLTWKRNPNYWLKDQLHPENQLPYLDGMKAFIIPDLSTRYAALRTGKLDILLSLEAEDWESLMKTNPELLWKEKWGGGGGLSMRNDVAPFNDVRVRRAMQMAINLDEMVRDYYGGKALKHWWPSQPIPEHKLAYVPLEEMPKSVQELFEYHPDKTKQLLAEAGYPNGFTTSVIIGSDVEKDIDLAAIVAAYWAKVGVTLKIDVKEPAVASAMQLAFTYPQGAWGAAGTAPNEFHKFTFSRVGSRMNYARINEPLIEATLKAMQAAYFDWAEVSRIAREAAPELIMLAVHQRLPMPLQYNIWQPWIKGFYGAEMPDYLGTSHYRVALVSRYVWIDQELKQKITGRR